MNERTFNGVAANRLDDNNTWQA